MLEGEKLTSELKKDLLDLQKQSLVIMGAIRYIQQKLAQIEKIKPVGEEKDEKNPIKFNSEQRE